MTDKYRQEVENSLHIAEQLHAVQCDYEALKERTGESIAQGDADHHERKKVGHLHALTEVQLEGAMERERRLHQTECEALEMKLQELSLMSEEDAQQNEQLRELLKKANADRDRLQTELDRQGPQNQNQSGERWFNQEANELKTILSEAGIDALGQPTTLEEANTVIQVICDSAQ